MTTPQIYILGTGAVGLALAVCLSRAGKEVILVRTRPTSEAQDYLDIRLTNGIETKIQSQVRQIDLDQLTSLDGLILVTSKSYANDQIAASLASGVAFFASAAPCLSRCSLHDWTKVKNK